MKTMNIDRKKIQWPLKLEDGFTLIELLLSLTIITFLLLGTAHSIVFSLKADRRSSIKIWAAELVMAKIEYLKSIPYDHSQMKNGSYSEKVEPAHSKEAFQRKWKISELSDSEKKIKVECKAVNEDTIIIKFAFIISKKLGF